MVGLSGRGLHWVRMLGRVHGYEIVAVCDLVESHIAAAVKLVGDGVATYRSYDEVLQAGDVDAVCLSVRSPDQGAMSAAALEAGKHVLAEVPAAHSIEDCWRIVLAAERTDSVYLLSEQTRYWGFIEQWRKLIAAGELGTITLCEGQYFHYYVTKAFRDPKTGADIHPDDLANHPDATSAWLQDMPPIHYLPHELSPMLKALDDRVVRVTAMSTPSPSAMHPALKSPDMQVALMQTEKGAVLRMAVSFAQLNPPRDNHWYQIVGTEGIVEWKRTAEGPGLYWRKGQEAMEPRNWSWTRDDAPAEAADSGHGDADAYPALAFRDAILKGVTPELDVYAAMDTAAPAILAGDSIAQGSMPFDVPDFRPSATRAKGQAPG